MIHQVLEHTIAGNIIKRMRRNTFTPENGQRQGFLRPQFDVLQTNYFSE